MNDESINLLICKNIKKTLKLRGIKQEHLAHELKITQSHLSERLNGKSPMKVAFMMKIALSTGIPLLDLIGAREIEKQLGVHFHNKEKQSDNEIEIPRLMRLVD